MDIYDPRVQRRLFGGFILASILLLSVLIIVLTVGRGVQASQENCEQYYQEAAKFAERAKQNNGDTHQATTSSAYSLLYQNCKSRRGY